MEALTCAARFLKWDARAKAYVPIDGPDEVAEALLSRGGNWKLPILSGVTKTPFLRRLSCFALTRETVRQKE